MTSSQITAALDPVVAALAARAQVMLASETLSVGDMVALAHALGELYTAARPNYLTAVSLDSKIAETPHLSQFHLPGVVGVGAFVSVNGVVLSRNQWHWDDTTKLFTFINGYSLPAEAHVEFYLSWRGTSSVDEEVLG